MFLTGWLDVMKTGVTFNKGWNTLKHLVNTACIGTTPLPDTTLCPVPAGTEKTKADAESVKKAVAEAKREADEKLRLAEEAKADIEAGL